MTSYDDLLQAFKDALAHALQTGRLSPICADFDVALIAAIGDVARAARDGSRTGAVVREACMAFGQYAALYAAPDDRPKRALKPA